MQLKVASEKNIALEVHSTSTSLDESLASIAQFLSAWLAEREERVPTKKDSAVVIDIGFLGMPHGLLDKVASWEGRTIYPIRVAFSTILLGPIYHAGQNGGPCPHCLEQRWITNHRYEHEHPLYRGAPKILARPHCKLHICALEDLRGIVESDLYSEYPLQQVRESGKAWFYALDLDSLQLQRSVLIADSSCPICALPEPNKAQASAWQFATRPKRDVSSYRLVDSLDYPLSEQDYINTACGMLGNTGGYELAHTLTAPAGGEYFLRGRSIKWGGHTTKFSTSRRTGMLEGLERYSGLLWPRADESAIIESYANLSLDALDPSTCGLYHPDTYNLYSALMEPFAPEKKITWVWGYSFRLARPILVPEQLSYYSRYHGQGRSFVLDTSSGCAAGSCLEEAILQGLLELVERDNFLIHWYAKLAAPRIDPWSSRDLKTLRLLDRLEWLGYDIHLLDTRLDLPFPTVTAIAVRRKDELGKFSLAAGAGLDPEEAVRAALCEVVAFVPSLHQIIQAEAETLRPLLEDHTKIRQLDHHSLLYGFPEMIGHTAFLTQNPRMRSVEATYERWNAERPRNLDLLADLQYCVEKVMDLGLDVIVVDQTAHELEGIGLRVARVIVPGLVPIDFGWGRHRVFNLSRMRTVPRTAGYLETDFDLESLNLTPHPFP